MIVCRKCGFRNHAEAVFCGSCGSFLEWTGEEVVVEISEELREEAEQVATTRKPTLWQRLMFIDVGDRPPLERAAVGAGRLGAPGMGAPGMGAPGMGAPGMGPAGGLPRPPGSGLPPSPPRPPGTDGLSGPPRLPGSGFPPPPRPPGMDGPLGPPRPLGSGYPGPAPLPAGFDAPPTSARRPGLPPPVSAPGASPPGGGPALPPAPDRFAGPGLPPPPLPRPALPENDTVPPRSLPASQSPPAVPPGLEEERGFRPPQAPSRPADVPEPSAVPGSPPPLRRILARDDEEAQSPDVTVTRELSGASTRMVAPLSLPEATRPTAQPLRADDQPLAVAPQAATRRMPVAARAPSSRELTPGDLVCGQCGEGNSATRKFCSRCGTSLDSATTVRDKWWRRVFPRRGPTTLKAGQRPGVAGTPGGRRMSMSGTLRAARIIVGGAVLVASTFYVMVPAVRDYANGRVSAARASVVRVLVPQHVPANPTGVKATVETASTPGRLATDGLSDTFWSYPASTQNPVLVLTYDTPVTVTKAIVRNGASQKFRSYDRIQKVHVVYSSNDSEDITLKDTPEPQEITFRKGRGVTSIELHISTLYRSVTGTDVALSEVEMFRRE